MVKITRQTTAFTSLIVLFMLGSTGNAQAQEPPNIEGLWAQKQVQSAISKLPILGSVRSYTTSILLIRLKQNGHLVKVAITPCEVKIDSSVSTVRTLIPQPFLDAIGTTHANAKLLYQDGVWIYDQAPNLSMSGAVLNNAWRDPLPDSDDDPRVFDADNDGNPGVTVHVRGLVDGSIYMVQRSWNALKGEVNGSKIKGLMRWQTTQNVIGASSILLTSNLETRVDPDASKSYFVSTRIDEATKCSDILKQPELFK